MKAVTRDRVGELVVVLNEWRKYVDGLEMRATGASFAEIPRFSDEHADTVRAARSLAADLKTADIAAPHLREWLRDPDDDVTDMLMSELARIGTYLPRQNGLSFDEAVRRKTSAHLRDAIIATRDAIPHVQSSYARDEELPIIFDRLLDPSLKTTEGSTMEVTLRKLYDILRSERQHHPTINIAVEKVAKAIGRE